MWDFEYGFEEASLKVLLARAGSASPSTAVLETAQASLPNFPESCWNQTFRVQPVKKHPPLPSFLAYPGRVCGECGPTMASANGFPPCRCVATTGAGAVEPRISSTSLSFWTCWVLIAYGGSKGLSFLEGGGICDICGRRDSIGDGARPETAGTNRNCQALRSGQLFVNRFFSWIILRQKSSAATLFCWGQDRY